MLRKEENKISNVRTGPARNLARQLLKKASVKRPPVYITRLIPYLREDYEIVIKSWVLKDAISGFLLDEENLSAIAYNSKHHVHRQRFTVAHEIGHLLLGHNNSLSSDKESAEKEAQIFATELLMPLELLKKDLKGGLCDIDLLRKRYWVSKDAMSWRIQDPIILKYI